MAKKNQIVLVSKDPLARPMEPWEQELAEEAKAETAKESMGLARITKKANQITIDGQPIKDNKLRCIVIDYIFTHTFFEEKWVEGKAGSPDCYAYGSSDDGLVPHASARDKQAESCDKCPHNVFRTAENGKGKRCPGGRKLAVIIPSDDPDSISQAEMRMLTLNSGSLRNWSQFLRAVADVAPSGNVRTVVTEISTEPKGQVFVYNFKPVGQIPAQVGPKLGAMRERARAALTQPWPDVSADDAAQKPPPKKIKGQR